jgi:hypothetical protein
VHAKGCVLHDLAGAREVFDTVISDHRVRLQPCLYHHVHWFQGGVCINEKLVGVEGGLDVACLHALVVGQDCRVSDERFAEEMFEEMESMPNYKPRPAPYNSMILGMDSISSNISSAKRSSLTRQRAFTMVP